MSLAIVTATLNAERALGCTSSWTITSRGPIDYYMVWQGLTQPKDLGWSDGGSQTFGSRRHTIHHYGSTEILGVVPAFAIGVQQALEAGHDIIACLHDDLEIADPAWDLLVTKLFQDTQVGLCGFGGGIGLGDHDIYQTPYDPMQLARVGFVSNMRDANAHGARSLLPVQVACLDGFSQIGRKEYWMGLPAHTDVRLDPAPAFYAKVNLFQRMQDWGIIHHAYDAALGCFAKRLGWQAWMLPIRCHHFGGRTAVADPNYQAWANSQHTLLAGETGDQAFWVNAHRIVYDQFRDVLPIRVP